jgi:hypothetical protein
MVRDGAAHELWRLDDQMITIPRHREINEQTARAILRALEPTLGPRWWQR